MSGIEHLVTQVKQSDQDEMAQLGGRPAPPPLTIPPHSKVSADPPPKPSCWQRFLCCVSGKKASTVVLEKTEQQSPHPPPRDMSHADQNRSNQNYNPSASTSTSNGTNSYRQPGQKYLLPPSTDVNRKTLVLDLDETLVHSSFKYIPDADFEISILLEGVVHRVYVRKRPGVDLFLQTVAEKWEVVIFTASLAKYADPLLNVLDSGRVVTSRLFREACVQHFGNYVKDLAQLGRKLENTTIIDNSPLSYMFQPNHAIPITTWFNDPEDRQLYDLLPFLDELAAADDVSHVLQRSKMNFISGGYCPNPAPPPPPALTTSSGATDDDTDSDDGEDVDVDVASSSSTSGTSSTPSMATPGSPTAAQGARLAL